MGPVLGVEEGAAAEELEELGVKTLVGVQAHWYPVLEMVVVTVTVAGPSAEVAEGDAAGLLGRTEELEEDEDEAGVEEGATTEEEELDPAPTSFPPMILLFVFLPPPVLLLR